MKTHELLKHHREAKKLSQDELADSLYISRQAVSKWERGESMPDIENILSLSDLYDISTDELLRGSRYLKKPYTIGEHISFLKLAFLAFFAISTGVVMNETANLWIAIGVTIILLFLYTYLIREGRWIIQKNGIAIQTYRTFGDRLKSFLFLSIPKIEYPYSEIESLTFKYVVGATPGFKTFTYDHFYMTLKTKDDQSYSLRVTGTLSQDLPAFTHYLNKKGVTIIDEKNLLSIAMSDKGLYNTMHNFDSNRK